MTPPSRTKVGWGVAAASGIGLLSVGGVHWMVGGAWRPDVRTRTRMGMLGDAGHAPQVEKVKWQP